MTYREQLHPWCIVCHATGSEAQSATSSGQLVVARFRRRNNAEDQLKRMQRLSPNCSYSIIFDPTSQRVSLSSEASAPSSMPRQNTRIGQPLTEPGLT